MVHPTTVAAPAVLISFLEHCARVGEEPARLLAAELDPRLLAQVAFPSDAELSSLDRRAQSRVEELREISERHRESVDDAVADELSYGRSVPFEIIPFAWQGGDALHYGHLVMAEELSSPDWIAVSFAPSEEQVTWLADDSAAALANLMVTATHHHAGAKGAESAARRVAVMGALGLPPGRVLGRGARSDVWVSPLVPAGYRFVRSKTGLGVLAPERMFSSLDPASVPFDSLEDRSRAALADGHPAATALQLLALQRADGDGDGERAACEQMIPVYEALGRPIMARRVETHLRVSNFE